MGDGREAIRGSMFVSEGGSPVGMVGSYKPSDAPAIDAKKLLERFDEAAARIEAMFLLAGVLAQDSMPTDLEEFFEDADLKDIEGCFGTLPAWLKEELEMGDTSGVTEWLHQEEKLGFLIQIATPVMTPTGPDSARFSWSGYTQKWVYGHTLDAALEAGFAFVADQRKKGRSQAA